MGDESTSNESSMEFFSSCLPRDDGDFHLNHLSTLCKSENLPPAVTGTSGEVTHAKDKKKGKKMRPAFAWSTVRCAQAAGMSHGMAHLIIRDDLPEDTISSMYWS